MLRLRGETTCTGGPAWSKAEVECRAAFMTARLHDCMAAWLHGCMAAWLHGCNGCMAAWHTWRRWRWVALGGDSERLTPLCTSPRCPSHLCTSPRCPSHLCTSPWKVFRLLDSDADGQIGRYELLIGSQASETVRGLLGLSSAQAGNTELSGDTLMRIFSWTDTARVALPLPPHTHTALSPPLHPFPLPSLGSLPPFPAPLCPTLPHFAPLRPTLLPASSSPHPLPSSCPLLPPPPPSPSSLFCTHPPFSPLFSSPLPLLCPPSPSNLHQSLPNVTPLQLPIQSTRVIPLCRLGLRNSSAHSRLRRPNGWTRSVWSPSLLIPPRESNSAD